MSDVKRRKISHKETASSRKHKEDAIPSSTSATLPEPTTEDESESAPAEAPSTEESAGSPKTFKELVRVITMCSMGYQY